METPTYLSNADVAAFEELYEKYKADNNSVPEGWRKFFEGFDFARSDFEEIPVGFKYVAEKVLKGGVIAGGEESGGYAFGKTKSSTKPGSLLPERDGLLSALLLLEMILSLKKNLSVILKDLEKKYGASCYLRNDIPLSKPVKSKAEFIKKAQNRFPSKWLGLAIKEMRTLDGLKVVLEDGSWILMRPSGTEPLLRTYAEFPKMELSKKSLEKLSPLIHSILES